MEVDELLLHVTSSYTEHKPSFGEDVYHGNLLGDHDRISERND
jgi:hypothetical protein